MALVLTRGQYEWGQQNYLTGRTLLTIKNTGSVSVSVTKINVRCAVSKNGVYYSDPNGSQSWGTGNALTINLVCGTKKSNSVVVSNLMDHSAWTQGGVTYYSSNKADMKMVGFTFSDPISIASGATVNVSAQCTSGSNVFGAVYSSADGDEDIIPPSTYTVTFDLDGGTRTGGGALTQTITAGGTATAPTCTKTGYTLSGWNKALGPINADTTIKATWTINKLSIVYNANGGTIPDAPHGPAYNYYYRMNGSIVERSASSTSGFTSPWHIISYGGTMDIVNIGTMNLTRTGYKIVSGAEWRTSATGGTSFNQSTEYPINSTSGIPSVTSGNQTLTIYANWQKENYTLTLKGDSGTFAAATGWTISGDTATKTIPYQETPGTIPTLTKSVTLTYNANGGTFNGTNAEISTKTLSLSHTWNTKADGTGTSYTDAQVKALSITSNLTLYAVHAAAAIGALPTVGTGSAQIKSRADYRFQDYTGTSSEYWTTTQNGTTRLTSTSTIDKNTTIWAKWEYRVLINANGGTISSIPSPSGDAISSDTNWKKHGVALNLSYTFRYLSGRLKGLGISAAATSTVGTVTIIPNSDDYGLVYTVPANTNAPITYYAIYGEYTFTVTFLDGHSKPPANVIKVVTDIPYGGSVPAAEVPKVNVDFEPSGPFGFQGWSGSYTCVTSDTICEALWQFNVVWIVVLDKLGNPTWVPYKPDPKEPDNR